MYPERGVGNNTGATRLCQQIIEGHIAVHHHLAGLPGGSAVENLPDNAGNVGLIPGLERSSGGGYGIPLQYSCLENPTDREANYSPRGCTELDTTEAT